MIISTWESDYNDPMTFLDMWTTNGTANRMAFSDEKYDELITNAREETDETKRYEKLLEAEDKLMKEAHIIPLFQDVDALLMRQIIEGMLRNTASPEYDYKVIEVK